MTWTNRLNTLRGRLFHLFFRFSRPITLGVRGAIIDAEGRIFLVRHSYVPGWHMPGGGVEAGETALYALGREVLEEGNIRFDGPPVLHGIFFNNRASRRDHVLLYIVRDFTVIGPRLPDMEIVEARFFPLDDLPEATTRGTRERLDEIFQGKPPAAYW
ncbi:MULTISPECIES: NUDIX domain-containing protein [unclassified Beijerinckia]|uniref:NUDIX domain-containing protein n=1 Tax=unclassified Beijerinckia TaxID=2638183 RepID=UPI000895631E|nr:MULTISPECIES: NUDIX domain-containing protein [unclassified Beijerinckia]MDH7794206.1 ADP-ribose pyrophosphatase YjhB (NUDIX family) [Beijerinckia sp. GAS462]SEB55748.1 ADP-ribose pyrophosphatase YjhB, NUDIX family [Beijerinckia sp. 28-YEA-48]